MYCLENDSPNYLELWSAFDASRDDIGDDNRWQYAFGTKMRSRCTGVLFRVRAKVKADSHHTGEVIVDPEEGEWTTKSQLAASDENYPTFYPYRSQKRHPSDPPALLQGLSQNYLLPPY